jgi:calcineurin-like phosphoesterase family protein
MKYFFTADEHFSHKNIIKYCNRPFQSIEEMNEEIIKRHNEIVSENDVVIHAGDFTLLGPTQYELFSNKLNGTKIYLNGSHDRRLKQNQIWERMIDGKYVVVCHYAMLAWPRSHYGSWQLFGHSHGMLKNYNRDKQYDIGVDNNNFYPVSFDKLKEILK